MKGTSATRPGQIRLSREQIDDAIARCDKPIEQYTWLQSRFAEPDGTVQTDQLFQTKFGVFYKLRGRGRKWRDAFFALLEQQRHAKLEFREVLKALFDATDQVEGSFASKLVATTDPTEPVIDSVVLQNVGMRLPYYGQRDRLAATVALHDNLAELYRRYLQSADGMYLLERFTATHPKAEVTPVKKLDFVLWQTRNQRANPA